MPAVAVALVVAVLCLAGSAAQSAAEKRSPRCDLFLGASTIPDAGLGLFTAVPKAVGETVGHGDVAFAVADMFWNNPPSETFFDVLAHFIWSGAAMGMGMESEGDQDVRAFWPGADCAINSNIALLNAGFAYPRQSTEGLDHSLHPGAGAITNYRNGTTFVERDIPAGGELFKSYGDMWFEHRHEVFGNIPLQADYPIAQELLERFARRFGGTSVEKALYDLILSINESWDSRVLNALPETLDDVRIAVRRDIGILHQPRATRTLDDLYANAKCQDHIVQKNSTIAGAGQGGFAKRDLPNGTIITGSPLLHYQDYKIMNIYYSLQNGVNEEGIKLWMLNQDRVVDFQVLLNYCYGNKHSKLLLCPYGAGVNYLNHNREKANVRIQWSKHGVTAQDDTWFEKRPSEMEHIHRVSLALDYVATRDIEEGEELFLDYGDDWIAAWERHVSEWKPVTNYPMADYFQNSKPVLPTEAEKAESGKDYPPQVQLRCHIYLSVHWWREVEGLNWSRGNLTEWMPHGTFYGSPCNILDRNDEDEDNITYTVELLKDHATFYVDPENEYGESNIREGIPREAIFFIDTPYRVTAENRPVAFRHPIGLPDELLPDAWRMTPEEAEEDAKVPRYTRIDMTTDETEDEDESNPKKSSKKEAKIRSAVDEMSNSGTGGQMSNKRAPRETQEL